MSIAPAIPVLLMLMLIGVWPKWPFSRNWGYRPSVTVGVVMIGFLVLTLTGHL